MGQVVSTSDYEVATAMLSQAYTPVRLRAPDGPVSLRLEPDQVGPVRLDQIAVGMRLRLAAEPLHSLTIGHVRSGRVSYRTGGEERLWRQGDVFLAAHPVDDFAVDVDLMDTEYIDLPTALLAEIAQTAPGERGPVRLLDHGPVSAEAADRWVRTVTFVRSLVQETSAPLPGLVTGALARLLAATTLAAFPSNAELDPTPVDRHDAHPGSLRRAMSFIESHPDLDLTVVDIAHAAFVSPRALQLAFRRHLDVTPQQYLRRVRLERAHADLGSADPATDTVTAIAARWGWARPSRFAADYLAAYGRHPYQTLRS